MILWTSPEAAQATGGRNTAPWQASGVSIDTRSLQPGDLFVALEDARDGHDFVAEAFGKGAAAAMVSRVPPNLPAQAPLLLVTDVLQALADLGKAARARTRARIVGITGSVGKTSTKEMLCAVLSRQGRTHASQSSHNNHWGVPLTLARLPADADFAVVEIGMNHPGEIAPLARMARPHVAIVTTVAHAHLEAFASIEAIAQEKAAIFEGLESGGTAIVNADVATAFILRAKAHAAGRTVSFGACEDADWRLINARVCEGTTVARAAHRGQEMAFALASPGRHFAFNALAALAAVDALGADAAKAATDLDLWQPPPGRGQRLRIPLDPAHGTFFDVLDDAFNANPAAMAAALDVLAATHPVGETGRRIAILGDMLELGPEEAALHTAIAGHPSLAMVDAVHCIGPRMKALHDVLPQRQQGIWVPAADDIVPRLRSLVGPGDVVLVKGSKSTKLRTVVDALRLG